MSSIKDIPSAITGTQAAESLIQSEFDVASSSTQELNRAISELAPVKEYLEGLVGFLAENGKPHEDEAAIVTQIENSIEAIEAQKVMIESFQESSKSVQEVLKETAQALANLQG